MKEMQGLFEALRAKQHWSPQAFLGQPLHMLEQHKQHLLPCSSDTRHLMIAGYTSRHKGCSEV